MRQGCHAVFVDRLLCAVVLALLHVLAGERDGRMSYRSMDLLHEAISLLLYPHLLPHVYQSVPVRHEIKAASPVRYRGSYPQHITRVSDSSVTRGDCFS